MGGCMASKLQGNMICTVCGLVKAGDKGVEEKNMRNTTKKGESICIDNIGPYPANKRGTNIWMCSVDEFSNTSWVKFYQRKVR